MLVIFFKDNNSRDFGQETFKNMSDKDIVAKIKTLDESEYSVYDLSGAETEKINNFETFISYFNAAKSPLLDSNRNWCVKVNLTEQEYLAIESEEMEVVITFTSAVKLKGKNLKDIARQWRNTEIKDMDPTFVDCDLHAEDWNSGEDITEEFNFVEKEHFSYLLR